MSQKSLSLQANFSWIYGYDLVEPGLGLSQIIPVVANFIGHNYKGIG